MFEDLIKETKPNYDKPGCWCCKFAPAYVNPNAIYCQRFGEYKNWKHGGEKCKEYRERIK